LGLDIDVKNKKGQTAKNIEEQKEKEQKEKEEQKITKRKLSFRGH